MHSGRSPYHMRNLFQNTFKFQGRVIDQNALHLPKPRQHLFVKVISTKFVPKIGESFCNKILSLGIIRIRVILYI